MNKTVGQAAYDKWAKFINPPWANIAIEWNKLPESAKKGWEGIAEAVINQQKVIDSEKLSTTS